MIRIGPWLSLVLALALLLPAGSASAAPDWTVSNGYQFTQAGNYVVVDDDEARFWTEFQRLGGVARLGYPISDRFEYKGFTTQAFQKLALQWRPEEKRAVFVNVFDELSLADKDGWLLVERSTPKPVKVDEEGKGWGEVVAGRLALLDANPAIRDAYYSSANPLEDYGLPTSQVEDLGPLYALRTQRVAFQQWKEETPWSRAGQVVVANGGDLAKEAELWPAGALGERPRLQPTARGADLRPTAPVQEAVPAGPPELELINRFRAAAGVSPATINPALDRAAKGHVGYYDANRGDPSLAGMGLHKEVAGRPGFIGATMGERARNAGYSGGTVTENAGFGKLQAAIEWHMNTVNHRLPLIHPSALDIGYGVSASSGFSIIDVGLRRDKPSVSLPSVYPGPGATEVPASWDGGETPDPLPGVPRPVGYPITVAFGVSQKVEWQSFSLAGPGGAPVAHSVKRTDWMRAAAIIPHKPLQRGATYTARVEAVVDGKPVAKEWSFTTRG